MSFPIPENESKRVEALRRYGLMDTPAEALFDDVVGLASYLCDTPIALISLLDDERQWFKAKVGLDVCETPREQAFCSHAIMSSELMVVEDTFLDERFKENALVTSDPYIRFYAGAPLTDSSGFVLGTLCVIDRKPRVLDEEQKNALMMLSRQVVKLCESHRMSTYLAGTLQQVKELEGIFPICSHCKDIRTNTGSWKSIEEYIFNKTDADFSHGICPGCFKTHYPDYCDSPQSDEG